jgi:hypothetical protein
LGGLEPLLDDVQQAYLLQAATVRLPLRRSKITKGFESGFGYESLPGREWSLWETALMGFQQSFFS